MVPVYNDSLSGLPPAERHGDPRMPVVDVDGLTFTYASGKSPAVRDLSFRIDRGETLEDVFLRVTGQSLQ